VKPAGKKLAPEVEPVEVPIEQPQPWFTVHLGFHLGISLEWCAAIGAGTMLLLAGKPCLLDMFIAWVARQ